MTASFPRARHDDLLVEDILDEVLIYDLRSKQAHCLNATAAAIWRACDGHTSVTALAAGANETIGAPCHEDVIMLALEQLRERYLIDPLPASASPLVSRRELMERVAVPLLLLPLITTLSVPTPAMAQSCGTMEPGPQGVQGPCGFQGVQGFMTAQGADGVGCVGFQGPQGPASQGLGFQGLQSAQQAAIGVQGVQGPMGPECQPI
jgi:hypothetical protein